MRSFAALAVFLALSMAWSWNSADEERRVIDAFNALSGEARLEMLKSGAASMRCRRPHLKGEHAPDLARVTPDMLTLLFLFERSCRILVGDVQVMPEPNKPETDGGTVLF